MRTTVGFCALYTLLSTVALGQTQDTTMIPRELALALIGGRGPMSRTATITVGRTPADFPRELLPAGVKILGALSSPGRREIPRSVTVVAVGPDSASTAAITFKSVLERAGWKEPTMPDMQMRGGFSSVSVLIGPGGEQNGFMLCRDSTMVQVTVAPRERAGSLYNIDLTPAIRRYSPCNPDFARRMMPYRQEESYKFPTLRPPAGAYSTGGGSCGSEDSREATTRLETELSPTALVTHYATQLETQGWTLGARTGDSTMVMQIARSKDDKGRDVTGILGAIATPKSRERTVFFKVSVPSEDP